MLRRSDARSGFTLIELLVVISIVATLAAVVGPSVLSHMSGARQSAARAQIEIIAVALESYSLHHGRYPRTEEGLQALQTAPTGEGAQNWRGPYLRKSIPLDPWGNPYIYTAPGTTNPDSYDLYTLGKDRSVGGDGESADVTSWGGPLAR